jgi:hypothetical protein
MKNKSEKLNKIIKSNKYPEDKSTKSFIRECIKAHLAHENIRKSYEKAKVIIPNYAAEKHALENEVIYNFEFENPNIPTFFRLQRGKYQTLIKGSKNDVCKMILEFMESNDLVRSIILTSAEKYFENHKQDFYNEIVQGLS